MNNIYFGGRSQGKTWALINGIKNQKNGVILASNEQHRRYLAELAPECKTFLYTETDKCRGHDFCIVADHFTWETVCSDYQTKIDQLEKEIETLKTQIIWSGRNPII